MVALTTLLEMGVIGLVIALLCMLYRRKFSRKILIDVTHLMAVCSFPHLFFLLIVIWKYPSPFISLVHFFFWTSTCVGLSAYLKSPPFALFVVLAAIAINYAVYLLLCTFEVPVIHLFASTGIYERVVKIAHQLLTADF